MSGVRVPGGDVARRNGLPLLVLIAVGVLVLMSGPRAARVSDAAGLIGGPVAWLLAASADLGPARTGQVQLTVALHDATRPGALIGWASSHGLSVRWRPGDDWGFVDGAPGSVANAFGVAVHDYRSRTGQLFYASPQQPSVPAPVRGDVTALGRILGYRTPLHIAKPVNVSLDVPGIGLTPAQLLLTYNATPLAAAGFTGKGQTIVFFEGFSSDGFEQADLDAFAKTLAPPMFTPTLVGGQPGKSEGETTMDLQVAHAIAPDAHLVIVNFDGMPGNSTYEQVTNMMQTADRQFPGAVWSSSIGWDCDRAVTAADLAPVQAALVTAHSHGTSAFDASGDNGGFECKGNKDWSTPPGESDKGLDAVASLPAMTDVGGTTLSTDANGAWLAEATWLDSPMSYGTGGGVSALFSRPDWQKGVSLPEDSTQRLTPDVAADADPYTGVQFILQNKTLGGGGTSQAAPIWAGLTALMDQYLVAHGGHSLGDLNPLLYRVAAGAALPAFHDVTVGGNAVYNAGPGFDLTTGLGTPDVDNLVHDLLDMQLGSPSVATNDFDPYPERNPFPTEPREPGEK